MEVFNMRRVAASFLALGFSGFSGFAIAQSDLYSVRTLERSGVSTECRSTSQTFDQPAPVLQGRSVDVYVSRHFSDVGITGMNVSSCANQCTVRLLEKGGAPGKGFIRLRLEVGPNAPLGRASLNVTYVTGGVANYPLKVIPTPKFTNVRTTADVSNQNDRIILTGENLDDIDTNSRSITHIVTPPLRLVSASSTQLVYAPTGPICRPFNGSANVDHRTERCKAETMPFRIERDAACAQAATSAGSNPPFPSTRVGAVVVNLNLTPIVPPVTSVFRSIKGPIPTANGPIHQLFDTFCAALSPNVITSVQLPNLQWGMQSNNATSITNAFRLELIDMERGRTLDASDVPAGSLPIGGTAMRNNYPGRPTSASLVKDYLHPIAIDATGQVLPRKVEIGCYSAPGSTPAFDPGTNGLAVRVDTTNVVAESNENDNELRF
jgi:hypothetical protein